MGQEFTHRPVLLDECIENLNIRPDGVYLDGTLGRAGHSREIAKRLTGGRLICVDRDDAALEAAGERLAPWMDRVTLVHSNFDRVGDIVAELGLPGVDGMLFDLGVSSPQLDDGSRGFSYMADAPLDMRMDRSEGLTAADVVNTWPQEELKRILFQYGEERYAPLIAAAIVRRREQKPIATTLELVDVIKGVMPGKALKEKQHPAKRSFQAIRIAVNDELASVERIDQGRGARAEPGRPSGGDHLPLSGGPHRQSRSGGVRQGLHLSAGLPRMRMRADAGHQVSKQKADPPHPAGGGRKSPGPQRQAAGGGEAEGPHLTKDRSEEPWQSTGVHPHNIIPTAAWPTPLPTTAPPSVFPAGRRTSGTPLAPGIRSRSAP